MSERHNGVEFERLEFGRDNTVARCLSLIEKHCPRLMREQVGVRVPGDRRSWLTPAEKSTIAKLGRAQRMTREEIAAAVGCSVATVANVLKVEGIVLPRGRRKAAA